jgi:ketosteroid isomerase-like protein
MTSNRKTIEAFMDGFRRTDRAQILACLTEDVEWFVPGAFSAKGRDEFARHIVSEGFAGNPEITVDRLTEADEVVVAEGSVRAPRKDGALLDIAFCDVFDMRNGKIRRLVSYLVTTN